MPTTFATFDASLVSILTYRDLNYAKTTSSDWPISAFSSIPQRGGPRWYALPRWSARDTIRGPFRSGELTPTPASWDFLKDRQQIEFQTLDPASSRTVWLGTVDGRLFLVSGYMNTGYGGLWKQWPHYLENDDRVILRVDGKLYQQRLERITGGDIVPRVLTEFDRKYGIGAASDDAPITSGDAWMFEVVSRQ